MLIKEMTTACCALMLFSGCCSETANEVAAEQLPNPSVETQYLAADVVVAAELVAHEEHETATGARIRVVVFAVADVIKLAGDFHLSDQAPRGSSDEEGPFLTVLLHVPVDTGMWPYPAPPEYEPGQKYLLFLTGTLAPSVGVPAHPEADSVEFSDQRREKLRRLEEELAAGGLAVWQYEIPEDAEERRGRPSPGDPPEISRVMEYFRGDELVGIRQWYASGQIAYERPMRDGEPHGRVRSRYPSGAPRELRHYRYGQPHGYMRRWSSDGEVTTIYIIEGESVEEDEYVEAAAEDPSLPEAPRSD